MRSGYNQIDVQLAHAARDELGELVAEVEHHHHVRLLRRLGRDAILGPGVDKSPGCDLYIRIRYIVTRYTDSRSR